MNVRIVFQCLTGFLVLWLIGCAATSSQYAIGQKHLEAEEYDAALIALDSALTLNPSDPKILRDMGIARFRKLEFERAEPLLLESFVKDSTDGKTLFYLGATFELQKKYDYALDIYSRYVDVSPRSDIRSSIEGRMEKIVRLRMSELAKYALENESSIDMAMVPDNTVAVLYFDNLGRKKELDPIQKGLAEMVITDLTKVKSLKVIERVRMQKLMEEMGLGMTGLIDESSAPRVGKLLGASQLVKGAFTDMRNDNIRIDAGLIPVKEKGRMKTEHVTGQLQQIFSLEKDVVFNVVDQMGIKLTQEERDAIEIIPTENLLAFMAYCKGLDYEDRGLFMEAGNAYREAVQLDPNFQKAGQNLSQSESLSSAEMEVTELEQRVAEGEISGETEVAESLEPADSDEEPEAESDQTVESTLTQSLTNVDIQNQMMHTSMNLDQGFLPGIDQRKPAQEQSEPSFGNSAQFKLVIPIPVEARTGGDR